MKTRKEMLAVNRLINSVWTLRYNVITSPSKGGGTGTIQILSYSRDDKEGYESEHRLPKLSSLMETDERIVQGVVIDGKTYAVFNPQHIFSYPLVDAGKHQ